MSDQKMVPVRYKKNGFLTLYKPELAKILVKKGEVEILTDEEYEEAADEARKAQGRLKKMEATGAYSQKAHDRLVAESGGIPL